MFILEMHLDLYKKDIFLNIHVTYGKYSNTFTWIRMLEFTSGYLYIFIREPDDLIMHLY